MVLVLLFYVNDFCECWKNRRARQLLGCLCESFDFAVTSGLLFMFKLIVLCIQGRKKARLLAGRDGSEALVLFFVSVSCYFCGSVSAVILGYKIGVFLYFFYTAEPKLVSF